MTPDLTHQAMLENYLLARTELQHNPRHLGVHGKIFDDNFISYLQNPAMWPEFRRNMISRGMDDAAHQHLHHGEETEANKIFDKIYHMFQAEMHQEVLHSLDEPLTGNPLICKVNNLRMSAASVDFTYFAWRIFQSLAGRRNDALLFAETGGGFGGLSRILRRLFPKAKFILLDGPEANAISTYFLSENFPESHFFLLKNLHAGEILDWNKHDFAILPGWHIDSLAPQIMDYVVNIRSMQEMAAETIAFYFAEIQRIIKPNGLFYCVNCYHKKIGEQDIMLADYPFDPRWKFTYSQAKWDQPYIHELIAQRLDHDNAEFPHPILRHLPPQNSASEHQENICRQNLTIQFASELLTVSYQLNISQPTQKSIFDCLNLGKTYEPELSIFLVRVLQSGDVFIDVGAHIGYFSMLAAKLVRETGLVISVEPNDYNYHMLQEQIQLNGYKNVSEHRLALTDQAGTGNFYLNPNKDGGHALWDVTAFEQLRSAGRVPQAKAVQVKIDTLDNLLNAVDLGERKIKLIKLDAEGAEYNIMLGATETFAKHDIPFIVAEINPFALEKMGATPDMLSSKMHELGYKKFIMHPTGGLPKHIPQGIAIQADAIYNLLFAKIEQLKNFWPVQAISFNSYTKAHDWR